MRVREKLSVTVSPDLIEWLDFQVDAGREIRSRSHGVELALRDLRDKMEKRQGP